MATHKYLLRKRLKASALALAMLLTNSAAGQQISGTEKAPGNSWAVEQNRTAAWRLAQHDKLDAAIAKLKPQRSGVVDVYIVSIGLDSDPVFSREADEAAKVLSNRYRASGRAIFLAAGADDKSTGVPQGSPPNLAVALTAVADKMNLKEDVLILYATTHGDPVAGLAYRDGDNGVGMIAPDKLASLLDGLGFKRRMILLSACYSGIFIPGLANANSVIMTAASSKRTSFGCAPGNDWTFFGDALVNNALRKPQSFDQAADEAVALVSKWENDLDLVPSLPQIFVGDKARIWLTPLEARMPKKGTPKVGRPAVEST